MYSDDEPEPAPDAFNEHQDASIDDEDADLIDDDSDEGLAIAAERLRLLYQNQIMSEAPQRDVLFHCASGLACTASDEDIDLAISIFQSLLDMGYLTSECRLNLARLYQRQGRIVKARQMIELCLAHDPDFEEAQEFYEDFNEQVKVDGKIAIYGLLGLGSLIILVVAMWRQSRSAGSSNQA